MTTIPKHYSLTTKQQTILNLLYRFRFATSEQLSRALNITKASTNKRLKLLLEQEIINRKYNRISREHAAYYLSAKGIDELKRISKQKYLSKVLRNARRDGENSAQFIPKTRYKILRYRDDYKIFTNQPHIGREVLKCLSETLAELGLRLNTAKTKENADPILGSVKEDKIDEMFVPNKHDNFSKWLMQIYATLHLHPNSGKSVRQLNTYHDKLLKHKDEDKKLRPYEKPDVMLSVITNLAIRNPKCYNWCAAIQSILLEYCTVARRKTVLNKIIKKFDAVPNTGLLDIWLQRITYPHDPNRAFVESMTEVVTLDAYPGNSQLWKSSWLVDSMKDIVLKTPIIDKNELRKITPIIRRDETALFRPPVPS